MKDLDRYMGAVSYRRREAESSMHWRIPEGPIPVPPLPKRSPARRWQFWVIGALSLVALSAGAYWLFMISPLWADKGGLGLSVEQNGPDVVMTWDPTAPAVRQARQGTLSVVDGSYRKEIALDAAQLRNGHILYSPETGDALLQLEVVSPNGRRTSESARVLGPAAAPAVRESPPAPVPPEPPRRTARLKKHYTGPVTEYAPVPPPPAQVAAPQVEPAKPVAAPPPGPASAANPPNYVAPKVIRQVAPVVPPAWRGFITHDVSVELMVDLDEKGEVSHVAPLSTGDANLLGLATTTVRQWRFQAARLNDRNLPSEMKVVFRFRAGGK